jgi:hypothetical protein
LRIPYQAFFLENGRHKLLLNVHHNQSASIWFEQVSRCFVGIAGQLACTVNKSRHRNILCLLKENFSLTHSAGTSHVIPSLSDEEGLERDLASAGVPRCCLAKPIGAIFAPDHARCDPHASGGSLARASEE